MSPLREWTAAAVRYVRRLGASERIHLFLTIALVLLGLALRLRGYVWEASAFWQDECSWAVRLAEQPLRELLIRPIGFMASAKALSALFGPSEFVLRGLPWVAGALSVLITPALARRLFVSPAARLLFVAIIALHPVAIDFSKEFKPYSVSLLAHLGVMLLALRYVERPVARTLAAALVALAVGILFTQDLVFAYPGTFLVLGWTAWRERPRHRLAIVLAALWIIAALALQYVFIWSRLAPTEADYWGDKYDVFHTNSKVSYASWWLEHQSDLAAFPGYRRRFWSAWLFEGGGLRRVDVVIWIVLHVAGLLAVLVERRVRDALLLVLPLATLWIFNAFGFWPAGVFRTNLFTIAYLGAIACVALDARRRARASLWTPIPALLLVVLPLCLFDRSWSAQKGAMTYESAFPDALRTLLALQRGRDVPPLVLDKGSHSCFLYYTELHPTISEEIGEALTEGFEVHRVGSEIDLSQVLLAGTAAADRVWVIMTRHDHLKPLMRKHQPLEKLAIIERVTIGEHTIAAVTASQADRPHRSRRRSRRHAR